MEVDAETVDGLRDPMCKDRHGQASSPSVRPYAATAARPACRGGGVSPPPITPEDAKPRQAPRRLDPQLDRNCRRSRY